MVNQQTVFFTFIGLFQHVDEHVPNELVVRELPENEFVLNLSQPILSFNDVSKLVKIFCMAEKTTLKSSDESVHSKRASVHSIFEDWLMEERSLYMTAGGRSKAASFLSGYVLNEIELCLLILSTSWLDQELRLAHVYSFEDGA